MLNISTTRRNTLSFLAALLLCACTAMVLAGLAQASVYLGHTSQIAFHDANGEMWVYQSPSYNNEAGLWRTAGGAMAAGTSPGIGGYASGAAESIEGAFEGTDNNLYRWEWGSYIGTGLPMAAGARPSVTSSSVGNWAIAYRSSAGNLVVNQSSGGATEYGLGIAAGSNPSITPWNSGYVVAFRAAGTNRLYVFYTASGSVAEYGLEIAAGSSPSIAYYGGEWAVAFRAAGTGDLYLYSPWSGNKPTGLGVAPNTNPSIIPANSTGRWVAAFNAAGTNDLYLYDTTTGAQNKGLGMAAGTDPSLTRRSTGVVEVAFTANTKELYSYNEAIGATDLGFSVAAGTSPSDVGM